MPPIKRAEELKGVSREHNEGLLLSWKIRTGSAKGIDPVRMRRYCRKFLKSHLLPHFHLEERVMYPILGMEHPHVKKAMAEHRRLQRLMSGRTNVVVALSQIEEELEAHIRFEERELFNEIQTKATAEELAAVEEAHAALPAHAWIGKEDVFWK